MNTRNNNLLVQLPKVKLEIGRKSFSFLGAQAFNSLLIEIRELKSKILFNKALDECFL